MTKPKLIYLLVMTLLNGMIWGFIIGTKHHSANDMVEQQTRAEYRNWCRQYNVCGANR